MLRPQPGVAGEEAHLTTMAVRDFVNEGGTVALSGVHAGRQYDLVEYPQDGLPLSTCDGDLIDDRRRRLRPALERLPPVLPGVVHPS